MHLSVGYDSGRVRDGTSNPETRHKYALANGEESCTHDRPLMLFENAHGSRTCRLHKRAKRLGQVVDVWRDLVYSNTWVF